MSTTSALRWTRERPGRYTALGERAAYALSRYKTSWSLAQLAVAEHAGGRSAGEVTATEHRIPTLALAKAMAGHLESGLAVYDAVARTYRDAADQEQAALDARALAALPDRMTADGTHQRSVVPGAGPAGELDVQRMARLTVALADRFGVPAPRVMSDVQAGPVAHGALKLGSYSREDDAGVIRLYTLYLDTGSILQVAAHEFAHHLEWERGAITGYDPRDAHGPRFVAVWDEVRAAARELVATIQAVEIGRG
ncbi:hypothetical protein CHO01_21750 [Cellulomonas hominis]|uniref:Uncharacterized protein n=1 Tax=Cellulomonas hominis TaxID=156981 RepID=A0A511FCS6_9CELL|nr:hypothetical protein [Cellulomonas hominis]MBB5474702.1 hypothetical protein [Cellulomonas hominis]NKY05767.1 hypothetical protein [Cellulomonas hominis]GEL47059.1 hypothetical protein CHO01_21750 [Cellulomonas hominis]